MPQTKSFVNLLDPGQQVTIIRELTKMELLLGLGTRKPIKILTSVGEFSITVNKVEAEDGSAESWCFEGITEKQAVAGWVRTDRVEGFIKRPTIKP